MKLIEVMPDDCTGCRLCEMACSLAHEGRCGTAISRIKVCRDEEFGNNMISVCLQCADPPCVASCAYGVLSRDEQTGVVSVDEALCTGCGDCLAACPLGAISLSEDAGKAFKCDLCGGDPECVRICPREVLTMKEIDPASPGRASFREEASRRIKQLQENH